MEKVYIVRIQKDGQQIDHEEKYPVAAAEALEFAIDMCGGQNVFFLEREISDTPIMPAAFLEYYSKRRVTE